MMLPLKNIYLLLYLGVFLGASCFDLNNFIKEAKNEAANHINILAGNIDDPRNLIEDIPERAREAISGLNIDSISPENAIKLIDEGLLPDRIQKSLICKRDTADKKPIDLITQMNNLEGKACLQNALNMLKTNELTPSEVNKLDKNKISALDSNKLFDMTKETKKQLIQNMRGQINNENDAVKKMGLENKRKALLLDVYGDPSTWKKEDITDISIDDIIKLKPNQINRISPESIEAIMPKFKQKYNQLDAAQKRVVMKKNLDLYNVKNMNSSEFSNFRNKIGNNFMKSIRLTDVPEAEREREKQTMENAMRQDARKGLILPTTAKKFLFQGINRDSIDDAGFTLLAMANPGQLLEAIKKGDIRKQDVNDLLEGMEVGKSVGVANKKKMLANLIEEEIGSQDRPTLSNYKNLLPQFSPKIINKIDEDETKKILKETTCFEPGKLKILFDKIESGVENLPTSVRNQLPYQKIQAQSSSLFSSISQNLPSTSSPCALEVDRRLKHRTNFTDTYVKQNENSIHCIGPEEAMRFSNWTIMKTLYNIKNELSPSVNTILLEKLANYTKYFGTGDGSMASTAKFFTTNDADNINLGIFAALGKDYSKLKTEIRKTLLDRMSEMEDTMVTLSRSTRARIVEGGLSSGGLMPGDLARINESFVDISGYKISNGHEVEVQDYLLKMQKWIRENKMYPCLDSSQIEAIRGAIKTYYGNNVAKWESVSQIDCLLPMLSQSDMAGIPDGAIMQSSCHQEICDQPDSIKHDCQASIGKDEQMKLPQGEKYLKKQQKAAIMRSIREMEDMENQVRSRRKRATEQERSLTCQKASLLGANAFSNNQLVDMEGSVILSCPEHFGMIEMSKEQATHIMANVIKEVNKPNNLTVEQLVSLGWALKGLSGGDIKKLIPFQNEDFIEIISKFGMMSDLQSEQKRAIVEKIKEWKPINQMKGSDFAFVGKRLCDFSNADIRSIPPSNYKDGAQVIGKLENCPASVYTELAKKANSGGAFSILDKGEMSQIGNVICGYTEDMLKRVPSSAFETISPSAFHCLSNDKIKAIEVDLGDFLGPASLSQMSDSQKSVLSEENLNKIIERARVFLSWSPASKATPDGMVTMVSMLVVLLISKEALFKIT